MADDIPIGIQIALGFHPKFTLGQLAGFSDIINTTRRQLWNAPEAFEFINDSPVEAFIRSESTADFGIAGGGTGARRVFISYIDINGDAQTQIVTLLGMGEVSIGVVKAINGMVVIESGSSRHNEGNIFAYEGSGLITQKLSWMDAERSASSTSAYHAPNGKTIFVKDLTFTTAKNHDIDFGIMIRFPTTDVILPSSLYENSVVIPFDYLSPIPAGETVLIVATSASGGFVKKMTLIAPFIEFTA